MVLKRWRSNNMVKDCLNQQTVVFAETNGLNKRKEMQLLRTTIRS